MKKKMNVTGKDGGMEGMERIKRMELNEVMVWATAAKQGEC